MKVAIVGCAHGELDKIYRTALQIENNRNEKIDLLICCGDFQATRNESDLRCMAVPEKFYNMGSFYEYYSGAKEAPIMTVFIGGNHEASNYLQELPFGGWVAPKIYYMGYAGVINVGNIRIGGLSGIFKPFDYMKGHFEKAPYNNETKRSVYHVRNVEVFRLKQISGDLDVVLSHDWPRGVYNYGCIDDLLKHKPFFRKEVYENKLGSEPCEELLFHLKPKYWFSAHLHTKFSALIPHNSNNEGEAEKEDSKTQFLALDKCLPKRRYIEVIDIPSNNDSAEIELSYDLEWLTILYLTDHLTSSKRSMQYMPGPTSRERWSFTPTPEEKEFVFEKMGKDLKIPLNFEKTVQAHRNDGNRFSTPRKHHVQPQALPNTQTLEFCQRLGITDPLSSLLDNLTLSNYRDQSLFNDELIPGDSTSTPDYVRKRKFSHHSFEENSNYSSFETSHDRPSFQDSINSSSIVESFDFPSFKKSPNNSPSFIESSNLSLRETEDFPSFKETSDDSSSADVLPFQIDRAGDVSASTTKQFKRRNASMYQDD